MNLGKENETIEFKESTGEVKSAMDDRAAMLNKHTFGKVYFGVKPNGDVCGQTVSASSLLHAINVLRWESRRLRWRLSCAQNEILRRGRAMSRPSPSSRA